VKKNMEKTFNKIILFYILIIFIFPIINLNVSSSIIIDNGSINYQHRNLVVDSNGILHAVYANDSKMYTEQSNDSGLTWTNRTLITDLSSGSFRNLLIDSDDTLWVFWKYTDVTSYIMYNKSTDGGLTWTGASLKSLTSAYSFNDISACIDSADDITVVYVYDWENSDYTIRYRRYIHETSTWNSEQTLQSGIPDALDDVSATPLNNGSVFITYRFNDWNGDDIISLRYKIINPACETWESGIVYKGASTSYDCEGRFDTLTNMNNDIEFLYIRENGGSNEGIYWNKYDTSERSFVGEESIYYDVTYPVLTCSISWTREGDTIALFSKHNVWSSTDKIHKCIRSYAGEWSDVFMMDQGNNYECENPSLCYQRYPDTWIFTQGFIFNFFNDTNDTACYTQSNYNLWYNGSFYPGDTPWDGGSGDPEGYGNHITLNVYNESNTSEELTFNIFVTNQSGSETYYDEICTNPYNCYYNLIPTGNKISFLISSAGYYPRQFYMNIDTSVNYEVNVYLAPLSANLYFMNVIDEYSEPVEDVFLVIKRYIDDTGQYENMTSLYTDGIGQCSAYLLPDVQYKVYLNKTGYYDKTDDWIPDPTYFGIYYPKYFTIYHLDYNITPDYDPWDYITFEGWMYTNGSIKINYEDVLTGTINATFYTYEINGSDMSSTLVSTNNTTNDDFVFWVYGINANRMHCIYLYLNHTILGYQILHICLSPVNITDNINETDIENKIVDVFGDFTLGYVNFFFVFLPAIFLLVVPGHFHPGIGILAAGMWLGFGSLYFGLPSIITILAPFLMMIGTILMVVKGGASKL